MEGNLGLAAVPPRTYSFIVTVKSREILAEKVKPAIESFLKERGLSFSKEKTRILSLEEGFDFLGQNVRKYNGILLIKPAKKNVQAFKDKLKVIRQDESSPRLGTDQDVESDPERMGVLSPPYCG